MMATRPLRRITLHFSHIFLTEALTFITTLPWAFWASKTRDFALSVPYREYGFRQKEYCTSIFDSIGNSSAC